MAQAAVPDTKFSSNTDPTHIDIPNIQQTTSHDPAVECQYYQSNFTINKAEWPTNWDIATSNGMNTSEEFQKLYNSIDWTKAPNIPVRSMTPDGGLNMQGYDNAKDPDCWWSASQCVKPKIEGVNADIYACPEPETWGLTFDDGPNCSHNAFYDYLEQNNQKASMFYIGSNVINWPYGALRGLKDGHHICGHTWSHKMMTTLTNQEVLAELYYTQKAIKYVTGITPLHWRPALGDMDDRVRWIATQLNLTAILWNLDTDDWAAGTTPGVTADTVNGHYQDFITMGKNGSFANSGNIVLSHEINNMTMDFAIKHYPEIKNAYKHVLDVATCMNISHPYQEDIITFPSFDQSVNQNIKSATGSGIMPGASGTSSDGTTLTAFNAPLFIAAIFGLFVFV
ncbi:uncharacterized protein BYT42DRAFT_490249 [Radiomyces spectabilis]|uniref:uncharacterized protein n=1 Tax=Radiomyces spectabilis TaxID=64574 RepID=UPI0022208059|nr:uncharacterized protein BYT42DRAFT_490249 [Radiomyces spectabilis]KAI8391476.1 hypothetical protein BYT42DRAFT_490249 [Radiomyces spectabilis]